MFHGHMGQLAAELLLDKETPDNEPGSSHWSPDPPLPVLGVTTGLQPPVSSSSARAAGGAAAAAGAGRRRRVWRCAAPRTSCPGRRLLRCGCRLLLRGPTLKRNKIKIIMIHFNGQTSIRQIK